MMNIYPDTVDGAKAALRFMADTATYDRLSILTWKRDPAHIGVWGAFGDTDYYVHGVAVPKCHGIVYLAGYEGGMGSLRTTNDFEVAD